VLRSATLTKRGVLSLGFGHGNLASSQPMTTTKSITETIKTT